MKRPSNEIKVTVSINMFVMIAHWQVPVMFAQALVMCLSQHQLRNLPHQKYIGAASSLAWSGTDYPRIRVLR